MRNLTASLFAALWSITIILAYWGFQDYLETRPKWQFCAVENRGNNPRVLILEIKTGRTEWVYSTYHHESTSTAGGGEGVWFPTHYDLYVGETSKRGKFPYDKEFKVGEWETKMPEAKDMTPAIVGK